MRQASSARAARRRASRGRAAPRGRTWRTGGNRHVDRQRGSDGQRAEAIDALLVVQRNDTQLVQHERVIAADLLRRLEVLLREPNVGEPEVLHPDEEQREVRPGEVPLRRRVGRDGLVMLAFVRERVRVGEPGGAKAWVDQDGLAASGRDGDGP